MRKQRSGMALPLMLLLLVAFTALAHSTLLLATREMQASWAFRHARRAGQAAELGNRLALDAVSWSSLERSKWVAAPLVEGEAANGFVFRSDIRWLDQEFFLLEGRGGSRGWEGERRRGTLGWSLLPTARLGAFRAVVEVGGTVSLGEGAAIGSAGLTEPPPGWSAGDCAEVQGVLDSLFIGTGLPPWAPLRHPTGTDQADMDSLPSLGLLMGSLLLSRVGPMESGNPLSAPVGTGGECSPGRPPLAGGTQGNLTLEGGCSYGFLVVGGDLTLRSDTRFQGLIIAGGSLVLEEGAVVNGLARVGEAVMMGPGSRISASACPALLALRGAETLRRPIPLSRSATINGF